MKFSPFSTRSCKFILEKKNEIIIIKEINNKKLTLGRTEGGGRGGGVQGGCHPSDFFS